MSGNHAARDHANLSASGSSRWLHCPPSAKLELQYPDDGVASVFAQEGTLAHELAELHLLYEIGKLTKSVFTRRLNKYKKNELFAEEMLDYVDVYVTTVMERLSGAKAEAGDAFLMIEQRLDFSPWVPGGFGTGDALVLSDKAIEVVDLKYGKGVPVSAIGNTQMRLYALGAMNGFGALYEPDHVRMTIVQPRLDSISTDQLTVDELEAWAMKTVKPTADQAAAGEGEFLAGDWCRFCRARAVCRARADKNLELAKLDFADPPTLAPEEIGDVLTKADELRKWAEDVENYALVNAQNGTKFPGWKLVEGRSNRKYTDEDQVAEKLRKEKYTDEQIFQKKLLAITKMQKLLGKKRFDELLSGLVVKPAGKPTLARESDKRPEIGSTASAVSDFS
ncbi:DUF2800 domain-containing protein [Sporolactobacillus shoreicorticis]|uniref:DUF2800 domain-containing protein n=1 Tax=Sporolactobacillus shoreicorticis TaxID=1923877 RepID=A0ABW5RZ29_9BACL|nr:DUF2800 domain-containing protein [Sporolactobacillus shoreicorticis]MCO7125090.1 DUF2800 domain-containing protein [Sporolactobacillus shoreicorticis]